MSSVDDAFGRAVARHQAGDFDAAERLYRQVLDAVPGHAGGLSNLGVLLARKGRFDEAAKCYGAAIAANPNQLDAYFNLGNLYRKSNRPREAAGAYREVLRIDPKQARAFLNLGLAVSDTGEWPQAVQCFRKAVELEPGLAEGYNLLGDALFRVGKTDEAVAVFREFAARHPDDPRAHHNLALGLAGRGDYDAALPELEHALRLRPDYPDAHNSLGVALEAVGRPDEAQAHYREAGRLKPDFADAWSNLGTSLTEQGRAAEGADAVRRSLAARPDARAHGNLLLALAYSSTLTPAQLRDEHVTWAKNYAPDPMPPAPPPAAGERLRVGYVSADFRTHTVAGFVEQVLTHHDRAGVHVTCYSNANRPDEVTARLQKLADAWAPIHGLTDAAVADRVRADKIDVLVDLGGHTAGNRLLAFARKPARAQALLFGYPVTTGLAAIDFKISDPFADPPGETDSLYTEAVVRLPDVAWVYAPPEHAPDVNPLPCLSGRPFTFGCLNNPAKLSDACVAAWADVLKAVGGSRLVLLAGRSDEGAKRLAARFEAHGVAPDRLELVYRGPAGQYFERYQPIDLALDPFPYNGGVTTCDALWMGVPVLTVAGQDYRSRQGVSLLNNLGLPEFVADTTDKLVGLAVTWSEQRDGLADIRASLREMMKQSPITDAARYVRHLEDAYTEMARRKA